jgi:tetratricopeptide (TPR) repeat protein
MAARKKTELASPIDTSRPRSGASEDGNAPAPPVPVDLPRDNQIRALEQALRLFREHRFSEAREIFETAAKGPQLSVTHVAKSHIAVCDRRIQKPGMELQTADDHYNYGVERLNARDFGLARKHLAAAVSLRPNADHMLYGLAAVLALTGDPSGSYENLKRAIEIDPRNRNAARHDADFAGVANTPLFAQVLHPERTPPF